MFEFCQAEKRWQVHYRLVCSTFCSQKAFSKIWLKRNQTVLQVLKEDKKHFNVPCRQKTGHRDSPNKASYYFYDRLSWQLIGRQFSVFPSTLLILCWRRLIASSYRLKTISSPQNPLIPSPSDDGLWLVFYVFFMIEIFSLRGGLPRMQSMTLKYLSSG